MNARTLSRFAPVVLRLGLSAVVAWFGASQLMSPAQWISIVPAWALGISHLSANTIVFLNGCFEVVAALLLAVGIFVRWVALLLSVHLIVITADLGLSAIGVRDFGLAIALFSVFLSGTDDFCFQDGGEKIQQQTAV